MPTLCIAERLRQSVLSGQCSREPVSREEEVIEGILSELQNETLEYLSEGYRVGVGEFGFFSAK